MAEQLTIHNVSEDLARRLAQLAEASGRSINATVLALLECATGIEGRRERLKRYTTWSKEDVDEFARLLRIQRTVDRDRWK